MIRTRRGKIINVEILFLMFKTKIQTKKLRKAIVSQLHLYVLENFTTFSTGLETQQSKQMILVAIVNCAILKFLKCAGVLYFVFARSVSCFCIFIMFIFVNPSSACKFYSYFKLHYDIHFFFRYMCIASKTKLRAGIKYFNHNFPYP